MQKIGFVAILVFLLIFFIGCVEQPSICGDGICSFEEQVNCSCSNDCGSCENQEIDLKIPETILTVLMSELQKKDSFEIDLEPLNSKVNLSEIILPSISVSGKITFFNKEDYLRIILVDTKEKEHLIFEAYYPLFDTKTFSFETVCNETCNLTNIQPKKIIIKTNIKDFSKIKIDSITVSSGVKNSQKGNIIKSINDTLEKNNEQWVAGETSISNLSYSEKKALFGNGTEELPNGIEYYSSGIYGYASTSQTTNNGLPNNWDWRNRHGKNWITSVKNQGTTGLCWAFSSSALIEATYNIYYNKLKNIDLSEEEFVCGRFNNLIKKEDDLVGVYSNYSVETGGFIKQFLSFAKINYLSPESCLPFGSISSCPTNNIDCSSVDIAKNIEKDFIYNCSEQTPIGCASRDEVILHNSCKTINTILNYNPNCNTQYKITDFGKIFDPIDKSESIDLDELKRRIILNGPVTIAASSTDFINPDGEQLSSVNGAHAMLVVGYETDLEGNTILIIKNSWGENWGINGYMKYYVPQKPRMVYYVIKPFQLNFEETIECVDEDKDGYCTWGIGQKPENCPSNCAPEPDCDDSNPGLINFDNNYNCVNINSGKIIVNTNPINSEVYINNTFLGHTPLETNLVAGNYSIVVKKEDYKSKFEQFNLGHLETKEFSFELERHPNLTWKKTDAIEFGEITYSSFGEYYSKLLINNIYSNTEQIQIYFRGPPNISNDFVEDYNILSAHICERDTENKCKTNTITQITFDEGKTEQNVIQNTINYSDKINFRLESEKEYLIISHYKGYTSIWVSNLTERFNTIDEYKSFFYSFPSDGNLLKIASEKQNFNNIQQIDLIEKIVGFSEVSECGNNYCDNNETYYSCPIDCPPTKQCLDSEPCCENNTFKEEGTICQTLTEKEFFCDGNNLMQRQQQKICSGTNSSCEQTVFSEWDLNKECEQICLTDTNTCSNYECWPFGIKETSISGTNVGECIEQISERTCLNGNWGEWVIIQEGVLPTEEICDGKDNNCDGIPDAGCDCIDGETVPCGLESFCGIGQQECVNGKWSDCRITTTKPVNTICPDGNVCNENGLCVKPECYHDENCFNDNPCILMTCNNPGDWNANCTNTNKAENTICGTNKVCNTTGNCTNITCTSDNNCTSNNPCQTGTCNNPGKWNSNCVLSNKLTNSPCGTNKVCDPNQECVEITCNTSTDCENDNPCKETTCENNGLWNSNCIQTNKAENTICGTNKVCNTTGNCTNITCTSDNNCTSNNPCQTGTCNNPGKWNSNCTFANKENNTNCPNGICLNGECLKQSRILYDSKIFNGDNSPIQLLVGTDSNINNKFSGEKEITLFSEEKKIISFNHDFSVKDLNLLGTIIEKGVTDSSQKYVIIKGLNVFSKKIYLSKENSSSNGVCVLDEEINDIETAKENCVNIPCPGNLDYISCAIENNFFVLSGLNHSFVIETYFYCGDEICNNNETCSTCPNDCGNCPQTNSGNSSIIICSNDLQCGENSYIGEKFCDDSKVIQTFRKHVCINKGTTRSKCETNDTNEIIEECSNTENCANGVCVETIKDDFDCIVDQDCLENQECLNENCSTINCEDNFVIKNHECVCEGTMCNNQCYTEQGICCENNWFEGEEYCSRENKTDTEEDGINNEKEKNSFELLLSITIFEIPIILIAIIIIVIIVIIIVILKKSKKGKNNNYLKN